MEEDHDKEAREDYQREFEDLDRELEYTLQEEQQSNY